MGKQSASPAALQALSDAPGSAWSGKDQGPVELKEAGLTQRDALLEVADEANLWRTPDGETFATVRHDGHAEHHAISSRHFRDWLLFEFSKKYRSKGRPASAGEAALRDARSALEARAFAEGLRQDAPLRIAETDGAIYIDTGWDDWSAFQITSDGWDVVSAPPVPIIRSRRTGAFPKPAELGDLVPLRRLLGCISDQDFVLFVAWCLAAMWESGPYPILILGGEQGSGKSTLARLAQKNVDPVNGDLLQPPSSDRDLIAAARHGRVLAFDNVSSIKADLADSICRLATGAEIGGRALFTDHDIASFKACRPIVVNGIPDLGARGDLADRSIIIKLAPLAERVTERDFWRKVEAVLPSITAGLLDVMVAAARHLDQVPTPSVRMADFARLIRAAEPVLPWGRDDFLEAYQANRQQITTSIVEGDLVATCVSKFIRRNGRFSGLMSELYDLLTNEMTPEKRRAGDWPGNPRWFSDRLSRAAPALRAMGIDISKKEEGAGTKVSIQENRTTSASRATNSGIEWG